jgi:UDP-N-acetylmuramoylalanine--D-glutamate ligase
VRRALDTFEPLPHRMEPVGTWRGVRFINDAKSTTLSALAAAVRRCPPGVRLIAGGLLKEHDLLAVKELLAARVSGVYLIGRAAEAMYGAWRDVTPCVQCRDLAAAVERATAEAREGETVLLSPGCASFDQFQSFEERGCRFVSLVRERMQGSPEAGRSGEGGIRWTGKYLGVR